LTFSHKWEISSGAWLSDVHIDAAHKILDNQYKSINGWESSLYAPVFNKGKGLWQVNPSGGFSSKLSPTGQIHYNGHNHWIFSCQTNADSDVYVLDSLPTGLNNLSTCVQMQLSQIYGKCNDRLNVKVFLYDQQPNSSDCGLYAIASAVEFAECPHSFLNDRLKSWTFDQTKIRQHFISCLLKNKFLPFPKSQQIPALIKSNDFIILMNCKCRFPDVCSDMVECFKCKKWYHMACVGFIDNTNGRELDWKCEYCML
jgi:hypothetical protein